VILGLIGASTTGLKVQCHLDERIYAKGRRIPDRQLAEVNLVPYVFMVSGTAPLVLLVETANRDPIVLRRALR